MLCVFPSLLAVLCGFGSWESGDDSSCDLQNAPSRRLESRSTSEE